MTIYALILLAPFMLLNKKIILIIVATLIVCGALVSWWYASADEWLLSREGAQCQKLDSSDVEELSCLLQVVFERVRNESIASGYKAFTYFYEQYPIFGASGCHQHAHRVGDTVYYELFVARGLTLDDIDFPHETTSCGYGFWHGFVEHLIQDHPEPAYVAEVCEYLRNRFGETMKDIGTICYHASGHGFTMARADTLSEDEWGPLSTYVNKPVVNCESLPDIPEREVEDCREGVFNIVSDWMTKGDLGLSFNYDEPFTECEALTSRWHEACYYEFAMKLEPITGDNPVAAAKYVQSIGNTELREIAFGVMIAGMMQRQAPLDGYGAVIQSCLSITDASLVNICVRSAINGMMEHGSPGTEYKKILLVCDSKEIAEAGQAGHCYRTLAARLSRFYEPEKKRSICEEFPEVYKEECIQTP